MALELLVVVVKSEMYVYISITDFKNHPDEITKTLGVKPTSIALKGDFVGKTKIRCKSNAWKLRVDATDRFDLEFLVKKLLRKFKNIDQLMKIVKKGKGYITCVFWSSDGTPSIELSSETIQLIAKLGCNFWVDYYHSSSSPEN